GRIRNRRLGSRMKALSSAIKILRASMSGQLTARLADLPPLRVGGDSGWGSALDRSVGREDRPRGRHLAVVQSEWPARPIVPEDAFSASDDERVDHHPELVDEVLLNQRLYQAGAPDDVQITAVLLLQRSHRASKVASEQRRVLPLKRLGESRRRDVLGL